MNILTFIGFLYIQAVEANPLATLKQQYPTEYQEISTIQPRVTRAGHLRFAGQKLVDLRWVPIYTDRFLHSNESPAVRRALLDLIARTTKSLPPEIIERYSQEDFIIQAEIIEILPFNPKIAEQAEKSDSPMVRSAIVRKTMKTDTAPEEIILRGLMDNDPKVLADAARGAHRRNCISAIPKLATLTLHKNGTVALRALYALSKLDFDFALRTIEKHQLTESPHTNLSLFAQNLVQN